MFSNKIKKIEENLISFGLKKSNKKMKKIIKICAVLLLLASCTKENDSLMTLKNSTAAISENKINAMMED